MEGVTAAATRVSRALYSGAGTIEEVGNDEVAS